MGQSLQLFLNDCNLFLYKTEPDRNTIDNYLEDFGVTTNALGTPESGAAAARQALSFMSFYPRADFEPGLTDLAKFLWPDNWIINKHRLLLGTQWVARRFARRHASSYAALVHAHRSTTQGAGQNCTPPASSCRSAQW